MSAEKWTKKARGHYVNASGWEVKRDSATGQRSYLISHNGHKQGLANGLEPALIKAGKMFMTNSHAVMAAAYATGRI